MKNLKKNREQLLKEIDQLNTKVTELEKVKQFEETLQEYKKHYNDLIDGLFIGIIIQVNNKIVAVNKKSINLIGANSEEYLIGKNILEFIHPADHEKVMKEIPLALAKSELQKEMIEERLIKADGSEIIVEVSTILMNYYGKPAILVMLNDITKRKQAEEKEKEHYKNIELLFKTAMHFVELPADKDIYSFVGEKLHEILGKDSHIICTSIDEKTRISTIRAFLSSEKFTDEFIKLLGRHPIGITYYNKDKNRYYTDSKMHVYNEGLYGLLLKFVSETECRSLEKHLNITKSYIIDLVKKELFLEVLSYS